LEKEVGTITHYFSHLGVAGVELSDDLEVGDTIHILGHTSNFTQKVESIQIEHETVQKATSGQSIGLIVVEHAREHDKVYKVIE
jgi:putative protease